MSRVLTALAAAVAVCGFAWLVLRSNVPEDWQPVGPAEPAGGSSARTAVPAQGRKQGDKGRKEAPRAVWEAALDEARLEADREERGASLVRVVDGLSARDIPAALRRSESLEPWENVFFLDALVRRWAHLDPEAAADWLAACIREWRDGDSGWKWRTPRGRYLGHVSHHQPQYLSTIGAAWAEADLERAKGWAKDVSSSSEPWLAAVGAVVAVWAEDDPRAAAEWALALDMYDFQYDAAAPALKLWYRRDRAGVDAWCDGRGHPIGSVLRFLASGDCDDLRAAIRWQEEQPRGVELLEDSGLARLWATEDPAAALTWLVHRPWMVKRAEWIARDWAKADLDAATEWAKRQPLRVRGPFLKWAADAAWDRLNYDHDESVLPWAESLPPGTMDRGRIWDEFAGALLSLPNWRVGDVVDWVKGLPPGRDRDRFLIRFMSLRSVPLHASLDIWRDMSTREGAAGASFSVGRKWAQEDPAAAKEWAADLPPGPERVAALAAVARRLADEEPAAVAAWLGDFAFARGERPHRIYHAVARDWLSAIGSEMDGPDPEHFTVRCHPFIGWADSVEDEEIRIGLYERLGAGWEQAGIDATIRFVDSLPPGPERDKFIGEVLDEVEVPDDERRLFTRISGEETRGPHYWDVVWGLTREGHTCTPEELLSVCGATETPPRGDPLRDLAAGLCRLDPAFAEEWLDRLPQGVDPAPAYAGVANELAETSGARAATAWTESLPEGPSRDAAVVAVVRSWREDAPRAAGEWLREQPLGDWESALSELTLNSGFLDVDEWAEAVGGEERDDLLKACRIVESHWEGVDEVHVALEQAASLPAGAAFAYAVTEILVKSEVTRAEDLRGAVADWIESLQDNRKRDRATFAFLEGCELEQRDVGYCTEADSHEQESVILPPRTAMDWALTIGDEALREEATHLIYRRWRWLDRGAARRWLDGGELTEETRRALE